MTELKQRPGDQPLPTPNDHTDIQTLVIADITARREVGITRYGSALQPFNGRDGLRDAYEEAMDLTVYLRQVIEERAALAVETEALRAIVKVAHNALKNAPVRCRFHGTEPPAAPAWHSGCESCRQPVRVRAALDQIKAYEGGDGRG